MMIIGTILLVIMTVWKKVRKSNGKSIVCGNLVR